MKFTPVLVSLVLILFTFQIMASNHVALVTYIKGDVQIIQNQEKFPAKSGQQLFKEDLIETGEKSKARLVFCDPDFSGTVVIGPKLQKTIQSYLNKNINDPSVQTLTANIVEAFQEKETGIQVAGALRTGKFDSKSPKKNAVEISPSISPKMRAKRMELNFEMKESDNSKLFTPMEAQGEKGIEEETFDKVEEVYCVVVSPKGKVFNPSKPFFYTNQKDIENLPFTMNFNLPKDSEASMIASELKRIEETIQDQEDPTIYLLKGNLFYQHGFYSNAILEYRAYMDRDKSNQWVWSLIQKSLQKLDISLTEQQFHLLRELK